MQTFLLNIIISFIFFQIYYVNLHHLPSRIKDSVYNIRMGLQLIENTLKSKEKG